MTTIDTQLQLCRARIQAACQAAGRQASDVTLMAVSKTFGAADVAAAVAAGQTVFGENYIQEAVDKMAAVQNLLEGRVGRAPPRLQWHCIGPIQSNKTRLVAQHFDWVHTVDRLKIAQRLSEQRPAQLAPLEVCIQVNVDGGPTKSGIAPDEVLALAKQVHELPGLRLRGLMCIPEPTPDFAAACAVFIRARALFNALKDVYPMVDTLSMGMSADLEAAIHSGSTLVRVGTAIFGGRSYPARAAIQ